ncbi:hypothetical protein XA68_17877 [Ophiocordyceps unilateralis]|uniref:tRNA(Phe) 7-[(3-amino-3-carboxypropyl)-4-demethylwyosine(37)-N(4)]-methyltransferase n=1 Tax=Ophiocordyceps unilateralis TaxID=268505 RepID=A0A2A9PK30_OPHUN|nr:hypothetical protein XA68_17877 [Ophiocordyceps unilateralis]
MRRQRLLPDPTSSFSKKKARILQQLALPDGEYTDASPKGSVDEAIRPLIEDINRFDGFVTTSSCAGRVSVFLEGIKTPAAAENAQRTPTAGVGGKGAGGTWLFVSHKPVARDEPWADALEFVEDTVANGREDRLIHFKFEPMILHVLTTSPAHAQLLLRAGLQAGFRESGAINIEPAHYDDNEQSTTPMVAIRSQGLGLESLIGCQAGDGRRRCFVSADYLETLRTIADERFIENAKRIDRFRAAFLDAVQDPALRAVGWEDVATRRERMRTEGLRRRAALAVEATESTHHSDCDIPFCGDEAAVDGYNVQHLAVGE